LEKGKVEGGYGSKRLKLLDSRKEPWNSGNVKTRRPNQGGGPMQGREEGSKSAKPARTFKEESLGKKGKKTRLARKMTQ